MSADYQPVARTDTLVIVIQNGSFADVKWRDADDNQWEPLCAVEVIEDGELVCVRRGYVRSSR